MTRDEAQRELAELLLDEVRTDRYPSATQMAMLEDIMPRDMIEEYLDVLYDKLAQGIVASVPLLHRIRRVSDSLPLTESTG